MHRFHALRTLGHHLAHLLPHLREGQRLALELGMWLLAVVWCLRTHTLMNRLGEIPDLSATRWDLCPVRSPGLVVIVPAKDEAETLEPAMETLLAQDYPWMRIVAVDDRSTDATGSLLERMAEQHPGRLSVLHVTEQAEGWMAKTFAMESAAVQSRSDWILFTDADVWLSPSLLRRALAYAEVTGADHLVIAPTPVTRGRGERLLLAFFSVLALWAVRPWRVADARFRWDAVGAGAFNLLRREAWEELGGFAPQRLAVVEDLTLGRRVRAAGMRQRLAFAPGLVLVHWATGIRGLVRGMGKNFIALLSFSLVGVASTMIAVTLLFLIAVPALFWLPTTLPAAILLACVGVQYREMAEVTGLEARWGWLYPVGALLALWALVRSAGLTLWRGGVRWRDTFYPLRDLRSQNNPFAWEWEATIQRAERRRLQRGLHPSRWLRTVNRVRDRTKRTASGGSPPKPPAPR